MTDIEPTTEDLVIDETPVADASVADDIAVVDASVAVPGAKAPFVPQKFSHNKRNDKTSRKPKREPRAKPEYDQKIIDLRRVTRVSSGGRRFSFSVALVIGNRKGSVGVGTGKAGDTSLAIDKAYRAARKNARTFNLLDSMSIPHEVSSKFKSASVFLSPAKGKGVIAGSSARDVIELAGIKDVNSKIHSPSKNKLNIARATIIALGQLKKRQKKVESK